MAKFTDQKMSLGARILQFRKDNKLTQMDLAKRYKVSGPAIFKFERDFVTPSLKLWQKISADMGIAEKEAVLLWAREKIPRRFQHLIQVDGEVDLERLKQDLKQAGEGPSAAKETRKIIVTHPDLSPGLKNFAANDELWKIFQPVWKEWYMLAELDKDFHRMTDEQFSEALIVGRQIKGANVA